MGIELTQRACRRIAAIRKGHDARLIARFIQCDEGSPRHVHFAAHLQIGRRILDIERNGVNGLYIRRHIFPHAAIPSCQTLDEAAVLIDEIHGKSVDLQLRDVLHMVCAKPCLHAAVKVPKLVRIECIRQREHGLSEAHLPEIIGRFPPTRCVGESGVTSSGYAFSRSTSFRYIWSNSKSEISGRSST